MRNYLAILLCLIFCATSSAQQEGYAPSKDHEIYYKSYGKGAPLLFINGGPGISSKPYEKFAQKLSKFRRVIIYDQRGTGQSRLEIFDKYSLNMDKMVADIESLRKHLGIEKWEVMGHSFGGVLAMFYASEFPEAINKLILSSPGGIDNSYDEYVDVNILARLTPTERDSFEVYQKGLGKGEYAPLALKKQRKLVARAYVYKTENIPMAQRRISKELNQNPLISQWIWFDLAELNYDLKDKLKDFQAPVLVLHGLQDFIGGMVPVTIAHTFPNSTLITINECGHFIWLDQPKQYFKTLRNWFKK